MTNSVKIFSGHQPLFLPYMGFFYKMYKSDVFIFDDDVQYEKNSPINSNYIKVNNQKYKITVPVDHPTGKKINEVKISYSTKWQKKLIMTCQSYYSKADHFKDGLSLVQEALDQHFEYLNDLDMYLINRVVKEFDIKTRLVIASHDVPTELHKNERNLYQCKKLGCNVYYSGIGGRKYNDEKMFEENGIKILYSDYKPVIYKQTGYGFIENLSVLDYIFNCGFTVPSEWKSNI